MMDFNAILDPALDRPSPPKCFSVDLSAGAQAAGLLEVWW